jgi:localization factor PodJL
MGRPWSEPLPAAIATKPLLAGIADRNPAAAYEIALRYTEGRGVTTDIASAAIWFARAAEGGLAPAQFRLGSMYEKGVGVKKDLTEARRLYLAAAAKVNATAMHIIAVLYAEGIDGKPDLAAAVEWFRRAAEYGVVDSQYNLAVLYARGVGVERNFAESFKWFSVAAEKGDKDAGQKRDEIAERLDPQALAAARLAASVFVPKPQPEEATTVQAPPGGWDDAGGSAKPKPRADRQGQRSARL